MSGRGGSSFQCPSLQRRASHETSLLHSYITKTKMKADHHKTRQTSIEFRTESRDEIYDDCALSSLFPVSNGGNFHGNGTDGGSVHWPAAASFNTAATAPRDNRTSRHCASRDDEESCVFLGESSADSNGGESGTLRDHFELRSNCNNRDLSRPKVSRRCAKVLVAIVLVVALFAYLSFRVDLESIFNDMMTFEKNLLGRLFDSDLIEEDDSQLRSRTLPQEHVSQVVQE
mmetsp:Transcript_50650/g.107932  ORF Transcript_50650/g.107932 Transcript_50650/m.107932 type:complete len:230 (+) Transcript_50650:197-886(+)